MTPRQTVLNDLQAITKGWSLVKLSDAYQYAIASRNQTSDQRLKRFWATQILAYEKIIGAKWNEENPARKDGDA